MSERASALYRGTVEHRRFGPKPHRFRYSVFHLYVDLDELEEAFRERWLWSVERPNVASFRRRDYFGDPELPLADAVRTRVEEAIARPVPGPVRLLTHWRYFGYIFNPVSFYYVFAPDGTTLEAVLAEITNTPWKERHDYVLDLRAAPEQADGLRHRRFEKEFHVSPFFDMDHEYDWAFGVPGETLAVHMQNFSGGRKVFEARLDAERRPLSGPQLAGALLRNPCITAAGHLAIYWQAARLWLKRVPFFTHPRKRSGIGVGHESR